MSVTVAGILFEHHEDDGRGDVLYLSVADYAGPPARAYASPEGHNVEYDESGRVIARRSCTSEPRPGRPLAGEAVA